MGIILIKDWISGLNKVGLTKLQMEVLERGLVESKLATDDLLDGKVIEIEEKNEDKANLFIKKALEIGAICEYIP